MVLAEVLQEAGESGHGLGFSLLVGGGAFAALVFLLFVALQFDRHR